MDREKTEAPMTRLCGFTFTTTGRPCANRVEVGAVLCRSGHPCPPIVLEGLPRIDQGVSALRPNRGKRATETPRSSARQ